MSGPIGETITEIPAPSKKCRIFTKDGWTDAAEPICFTVSGLIGFVFFSHSWQAPTDEGKLVKCYTVTEHSTGFSLSNGKVFQTREEAVEDAVITITKQGKERFLSAMRGAKFFLKRWKPVKQ